jgi:hypothetical protein
MLKHWETTLAGVATIVGALCAAGLNLYHGQPLNFPVLASAFTAGVGLIRAADANKS